MGILRPSILTFNISTFPLTVKYLVKYVTYANLLLTWLDLRDAFGSVSHELILSTMKRLGLSGSVVNIVQDIYSHSTVAVRMERVLHPSQAIPPLTWDKRHKYLGCPTGTSRTPANTPTELSDTLLRDTNIVLTSELAEWQKLDAFRRFLFPHVTIALKVVFPGVKWNCTKYIYLSTALGVMGVPCIEDESHVARWAQAFKFLADTRDPRIRDMAMDQLTATVTKRARYLDPTNPEHLVTFLNTSQKERETSTACGQQQEPTTSPPGRPSPSHQTLPT
ncbi:hypothetical protein EMCRGX_G005514 [Ephydatia muelleri]